MAGAEIRVLGDYVLILNGEASHLADQALDVADLQASDVASLVAWLERLVVVRFAHPVLWLASLDGDSGRGLDVLGILGWRRCAGAIRPLARFYWFLGDRIQGGDELTVVPFRPCSVAACQQFLLPVVKRMRCHAIDAPEDPAKPPCEAAWARCGDVSTAAVGVAGALVFHVLYFIRF